MGVSRYKGLLISTLPPHDNVGLNCDQVKAEVPKTSQHDVAQTVVVIWNIIQTEGVLEMVEDLFGNLRVLMCALPQDCSRTSGLGIGFFRLAGLVLPWQLRLFFLQSIAPPKKPDTTLEFFSALKLEKFYTKSRISQ